MSSIKDWSLYRHHALKIAAVVAAMLLLTISAYVQMPVYPVKISMQTAAVFAIGVLMGPRLAAVAVLAYIVQGIGGMPVFQNGAAGPAYLAGPTGGYLLGFVFAAFVVGWGSQNGWMKSFLGSVVTLLAATAILYAPGIAWLAILFGVEKAVAVGSAPFLVGDALKILLVASLVSVGALHPLFKA